MRLLQPALAGLLVAAPLAAQGNGIYTSTSLTSGAQFKSYTLGDGAQFERISQFAVPVAVVVPVSRRFSLDVGTYFATTSARTTGGDHTLSGLTDAQLRGTYVFGRDAGVISVVVNLPTGATLDSADAVSAGAAASNFLLFPVNSYANGFSVTGGAGITRRIGAWGVGIAGSLRWNAEYSPFQGSGLSDISYDPGTEGRIRVGADRLIGQGRFRLGVTYSTFGDDLYSGSGAGASSSYTPGDRFVVEGGYSWPGLGGTLTAYAWNYHRASGAVSDTTSENGENILAAGLSGRMAMGPNTVFEPALEGRFWSYNAGDGGGKVVGLAAGIRRRLSDHLALVPNVRAEFGSLDLVGGGSANVTGFGGSVLLRYGF